jgi:cyclopropane fatty-acyl-phospholipid synthase-like methyltransferase
MVNLITVLKIMYQRLLPASVKNSKTVAKLKAHLLGHNWIYDSNYYESTVEGPAVQSAGRISSSILNDLKAMSVIDVGCGTGALLEALRDKGCNVFGLEYSEAALKFCRARRLNVVKFDLERDTLNDNYQTFDVAVSTEVAEHLPEIVADRYVKLLTHLSKVIVFTAAPPGQEGDDHVNLQPPSYWIQKFQQRGFIHDIEQSQRWRESWKAAGDVEGWYYKNLMIFRQTL